MSWLNKKPEGDAAVSPVASDVDKKRITFPGSERVLENKQARLKAEYTTDKVFTQASVKRGFEKVESVKKIPGKARDEISRDLWLDLEAIKSKKTSSVGYRACLRNVESNCDYNYCIDFACFILLPFGDNQALL